MIAFFILGAAAAVAASTPPVAAAASLIERDWVIHQWALKAFDRDGDRVMSPAEVEAATAELRTIADGNGDGRVTPVEFRAARAFILARY